MLLELVEKIKEREINKLTKYHSEELAAKLKFIQELKEQLNIKREEYSKIQH